MLNRIIIHVDINSYFATMLQQENPFLRGKPIGVVKDAGRTCLIATSKEAKKYGVKTGIRLKEALLLCPQIMALPTRFDSYLDATRRLKKLFHALSPQVFIYSLDEAFIDLTGCIGTLYESPLTFARYVQDEIKKELGEWVTCNVGISHNRLLAKLASETTAAGTIFEINEENLDAVLASVKFADVCGVGHRLEEKLKILKIYHPYHIRFFSEEELAKVVGPFWAKELLKIAYGRETHLLEQVDHQPEHMKSVGRSITGYSLCDNEDDIKATLYNLVEEVTYKTRKMNLAGRLVYVSFRGEDGQYWHKHITIDKHICHTTEMFELLYYRLYKSWDRSFKIIKFSVRLALLKRIELINPSLLPEDHRNDQLSAALDKLTLKYGLFTVKSAAMMYGRTIKPEVTGFLGDRTYYGL